MAAEGLSPYDAKIEADITIQLSVFLVENAIVILMLVEDHLRLQRKLYMGGRSSSTMQETMSFHSSTSGDLGALSLNILASMAEANGQISTVVKEQLTVATAPEPYESVSCVFVSYGSCVRDVSEGWKYRSQLWYGVGLPEDTSEFGGGGSGWESWKSELEKDTNGSWIELPLINKSMSML